MTSIPLPTGMRGKQDSPKQTEKLIDCYFKVGGAQGVGTIITRPGVYKVASGGGCRGSYLFKDELYQVSGGQLIRLTVNQFVKKKLDETDVVKTELGLIDGNAQCVMAAGFTELCILVKSTSDSVGKAYIYNTVSGLQEITDPSFQPSVSVAYDAGRFVFVPENGGPFFWTDLADPSSISAQSYADAEEFPDPNKAVQYIRQSIDVLGSRSIERIQYQPNLTSYARVQSVSSNVGYAGGLTDLGESYAFIGIEDGGYSVYVMGAQPMPVPNDYIDELLNLEYSRAELGTAIGNTFRWNGQLFAMIHLPRHTLVLYSVGQGYDIALWHSDITSDNSAKDEGTLAWGYTQSAYGYTWVGGSSSSNIGIMFDEAIEYGENIQGGITTFLRTESRSNSVISRVFLACTTGQANGENQMYVSFSRDGKIYPTPTGVSLGQLGDHGKEVSWGPVGQIDNFLGIKFSWIGQVSVNSDGVYFK